MSLRDDLSPDSDVWTDEIDRLMDTFSGDLFDKWEVYERGYKGRPLKISIVSNDFHSGGGDNYPSQGVQLAYLPESIKPTDWIQHTNEVYILHRSRYKSDFDIDPEDDSQNEPKYIVKGTFVDPIVTRSVERAVEHVENQMERVAVATEFNAEIERLTYSNYFQQNDQPSLDILESSDPKCPVESKPSDQDCPVKSVDGVGPTSTERLARRFGTYYNVTRDEHPAIRPCLSDFHQTPISAVIEAAGEAVDRYNELRKREEWDRVDVEPDTWIDYPKADPR